MNYTTDCLIIGSGAAGLTLALGLADKTKVIVLSKENVCAGSTNYAQGGIAGVYNIKDDNPNSQNQSKKCNQIYRKSHHINSRKCPQNRYWHCKQWNKCRPKIS